MNPYTRFAEVYDRMGSDRHSIKMTDYCFRIFRKFRIKPINGLDLCCGTGTAAAIFADRGIKMAGLDQSAHMLAVAAKKLGLRGVTLYQKSLPRFKILGQHNSRKTRKFDLVTSFFDSLNYLLTERDLKASFRSVYNHLEPGGWFVFDMNTQEALKVIWSGQVYADARDDIAWVWKNEYNAKKRMAYCHANFFVRTRDHWERFYEMHTERAYPNAVIKRLLREVGFTVKGYYRCFSFENPKRDAYRICAVVQRKI